MIEDVRLADVAAIRAECASAAAVLLATLESVLSQADRLAEREPHAAQELREAGIAGLVACGFEDIVGQLLSRLSGTGSDDPMLLGPACAGSGLSQSDIDAAMSAAGPP